MAEFKVQRLRTDLAASASLDIQPLPEAVNDLSAAFPLIGNNRLMGAGATTTTVNLESDDFGMACYLDTVSSLRYSRLTTGSVDNRTDVEILEYTGIPGGPNEFIVLGRYTALVNPGSTSVSVTVDAPTISRNKCIPFIAGIISYDTDNGAARATAVAVQTSDTNVDVICGGSTTFRVIVRIVLVEFTGSAWSVGHGYEPSSIADTGEILLVEEANGDSSGTPFDVSSWDNACIFGQHCGDLGLDTNEAIADNWPLFAPSSTSSVYWYFADHHDALSNKQLVHILHHPLMDVQRIADTTSNQGTANVTIPSTLDDISQAFVIVTRVSSGTGTAYGRGWVNARITSTSNIELWAHRSSTTVVTALQVVNLYNIIAVATARRRIIIC
jgi:trimeric autotransporter adhesin